MKSSSSSKHTTRQPGLQVRTYLAALPAGARSHLQELREPIRAAAPGAVESFGYGMPALALVTARSLAAELEQYEISGKGTIRFRLDQRLVKARIAALRRRQLSVSAKNLERDVVAQYHARGRCEYVA
jgi:uncharacterized protein YdhG (YjbR/CyaY superfamily)